MRLYTFFQMTFDCVCSIERRAVNTTPSGTTTQILLHQRYSWRRDYWGVSAECTSTTIANQQLIASGTGTLTCFTGGSCGSFASVSADVYCTDFSASTDSSSGEKYTTYTLDLGDTFVVGFYSSAWLALAIGGNGAWQLTAKIQLTVRPDGVINTSPVTSTLPVIYQTINVQHVHVVQMSDADTTDTLRCRWATDNSPANFINYDECGSVCAPSLPTGYVLYPDNCTLVFTLTVAGPTAGLYAVALQIEDYFTSTSPTPMSSVPVQFLFEGIVPPSGCSTPPTIIGVRPNLGLIAFHMLFVVIKTFSYLACIGTPIGKRKSILNKYIMFILSFIDFARILFIGETSL
jgi:hypothetical protein